MRQLWFKFGQFWAKIHREMICQSWLLLSSFFNFPIVMVSWSFHSRKKRHMWEWLLTFRPRYVLKVFLHCSSSLAKELHLMSECENKCFLLLPTLWSVKMWKMSSYMLPCPLIFLSCRINRRQWHCLYFKKLAAVALALSFSFEIPHFATISPLRHLLLLFEEMKKESGQKRWKNCGGVKEWLAASWGKWWERERDKCRVDPEK